MADYTFNRVPVDAAGNELADAVEYAGDTSWARTGSLYTFPRMPVGHGSRIIFGREEEGGTPGGQWVAMGDDTFWEPWDWLYDYWDGSRWNLYLTNGTSSVSTALFALPGAWAGVRPAKFKFQYSVDLSLFTTLPAAHVYSNGAYGTTHYVLFDHPDYESGAELDVVNPPYDASDLVDVSSLVMVGGLYTPIPYGTSELLQIWDIQAWIPD